MQQYKLIWLQDRGTQLLCTGDHITSCSKVRLSGVTPANSIRPRTGPKPFPFKPGAYIKLNELPLEHFVVCQKGVKMFSVQ